MPINQRRFIIRSKEVRQFAVKTVGEIPAEPLMEVIIRPFKEDKTGEQRAWFHTLCGMLGEELGYTLEEVKEIAKKDCFGAKTVTIADVTREVVKSSEKAKRDEYSALIETVYRLAAFSGVVLPPPRARG